MIRALVFALLASPVAAQEFVPFDTAPTDDQFYRAIACAAPPDGDCAKPFLHWPAPDRAAITIGLVSITPTLTGPSQRLFEAGLADAIAQLNATGAGLTLQRDDVTPNIEIHIVPTPPNHPIFGTGIDGLDGEMLQLGRVALLSRGGEIQRGLIAVSAFARDHEIAPVLLEEVTQSLGLMTDLRGPGTETSVFGEDTNSVTHLSPRDIAAIQRHYSTP